MKTQREQSKRLDSVLREEPSANMERLVAICREAERESVAEDLPRCDDPNCRGVLDADGLCILCGVDHSAPCQACEARGFHVRGCPESDESSDRAYDAWRLR